MRNTKPALKRIIGGGFALATAAAFVVPGVALADEPDAGSSLSSLQDMLPGTGSTDDTTAAADDGDGDSMFGSITDVFGCFSSDDGEGDEDGTTNAADDGDGIGSVTTVIDCIVDAIGGGDEDPGTGDEG